MARTPRRRRPRIDSRQRLFDAAAAEFAARGFAGASVDRIARSARLNKAMIYYHFGSKAALYRAILSDMLGAVAGRVAAIAESGLPPPEKIRAFVDAIAAEAEARPHFPPIWFREIVEGGAHVDAAIIGYMARVLRLLGGIIEEGRAARRFTRTHPFLVHAAIIAPLLLFFATEGIRGRAERAGVGGIGRLTRKDVVSHVQRVALATLEGRVT